MDQATIAPIVKKVTVNCSQETAFRVFTERFGEWWPVETHSIGQEKTQTAYLEPRVGGRIYEVMQGGGEAPWGTVTDWEPPSRIEFDWKVNPDAPAPTHVVVIFRQEGERTLVELEHRGWGAYAKGAMEARGDYDSEGGWPLVLGRFADVANSGAA